MLNHGLYMIELSQKTEEKLIKELKWRFNLTDVEIKDTLDKTVQYLNSIKTMLQIDDPKQLEALAIKLIKIS